MAQDPRTTALLRRLLSVGLGAGPGIAGDPVTVRASVGGDVAGSIVGLAEAETVGAAGQAAIAGAAIEAFAIA